LRKVLELLLVAALVLSFGLLPSAAFSAVDEAAVAPEAGPAFGDSEAVKAFWDQRHTFEELEQLLKGLAAAYPNATKLYSVGHTWEERPLWCLEVSGHVNTARTDGKTPIALIGNIHGGEQESGESVAYTAWWLLSAAAAGDAQAARVMDEYVTYIIPVMNPDGYVNSFTINTRQNMRPTDRNGVGGPFSDPYLDLNGDGIVGQMYTGGTEEAPPAARSSENLLGYESRDRDGNGVFGDDPKGSAIDLNRTFDYLWNYNRPYETPALGANAWASAGAGAATEPEVEAIQNFLKVRRPAALITAHTGIQCVLYPWCYSPNPSPDDAFFAETAEAMRAAFENTVVPVRGEKATFYVKRSYEDYPTSAEMIDWAYGRLGIHAYTVEVYSRGTGQDQWQDPRPSASEGDWVYLGDISDGRSGGSRATYEDVWIWNARSQQLLGHAPPDQQIMGEGFKNSALVMIFSEGPQVLPS
jgi:hypothetical protein